MKKFKYLALILVLCLLLPVFAACDKTDDEGNAVDTLVVYNWEDYIDESQETSRLEAFKAYYKETTGNSINIVYSTFDTNETMLAKVLNNDAQSVDLICPSDYAVQKLMMNHKLASITDLIAEYNGSTLPNGQVLALDNLNTTFQNTDADFANAIRAEFSSLNTGDKVESMEDYIVPYMMGTLGILYNKNYVSEEELEEYGWGILWNEGNNEDIENKILVKDSVRDTYCAAVMYMKQYDLLPEGYESKSVQELINCTDQVMLDAAEDVLTAQREHISGYEVDFGKDDMLNEIVYVDLAWSGDALWAIEESYDEDEDDYYLGYYVPQDELGRQTGNIWFDGWVIPETSSHKRAALMFIDFMNNPANAIYNSIYIGYTSAVSRDRMMYECDVDGNILYEDGHDGEDGYELINEDVYEALVDSEYALAVEDNDGDYDFSYFEDEGRYPTILDTTQLGVMRDFGDRSEAAIKMWENAKTGKDVPWVLIWCTVAIIGFALVVLIIWVVKEKNRLRPRKIN